jgi:hypothetical protein
VVDAGVAAGPDDPVVAALAEAAGAFEFEARVERMGDALLFTIGRVRGAQAAPSGAPAPGHLWQPGPQQLVYSHWDVTPLRTELLRARALWQRWAETPVGRKAAELDENDFLGSIEPMARQLESVSATGALRAVLMDEGVDITVRLDAPRPAPDLRSTPLLEWLPASAELVSLDATQSLAETLSNVFLEAESRLDRLSLKAELGDDEARAERLRQASEFYYKQMARFRELIYKRSVEVFEPPSALIVRMGGRLESFRLKVEGLDSSATYSSEAWQLPVPEVALVARVREEAAALELIGQLQQALADAVAAGLGLEPPKLERAELPLELGVPAYGFAGGTLQQLLQAPALGRLIGAEGQTAQLRAEFELRGDLQPHYFVRDGYLVMSSSPRLSADLTAAVKAQPGARLEPRAPGDGRLVAYGRLPAATISRGLEMLARWLRQAAPEPSEAAEGMSIPSPGLLDPDKQQDLREAAALLEALPELVGLIEDLQWTAVDDQSGRLWHEQLRWKKP